MSLVFDAVKVDFMFTVNMCFALPVTDIYRTLTMSYLFVVTAMYIY